MSDLLYNLYSKKIFCLSFKVCCIICFSGSNCNEADICGENAECVYDENLREYYCECMDEFSGDGFSCEPASESMIYLSLAHYNSLLSVP